MFGITFFLADTNGLPHKDLTHAYITGSAEVSSMFECWFVMFFPEDSPASLIRRYDLHS
jgi:hypothetical protein